MRAGRTHPTYIELQTNRPMYVHRRGSNIVNGEYYVDYNPERPIGHYGQTRKLNTAALRKHYEEALKADVQALAKNSPLAPGAGIVELPRFFADRYAPPAEKDLARPGARLARGAEQDGLLAGAVAADQPSLQGPVDEGRSAGRFRDHACRRRHRHFAVHGHGENRIDLHPGISAQHEHPGAVAGAGAPLTGELAMALGVSCF